MTSEGNDLLTELNVQVKNICAKLTVFHNENKEDHRHIQELFDTRTKALDDKVEKKVNFNTFKMAVVIIATVMFSMFAYGVGLDKAVTILEAKVAPIETLYKGN